MKIHSTFRILVLFIALLIFSSHSAFGRGPRPNERGIERKRNAVLLVGDHEGIDEKDVQNAALLVTEELGARGITVNDPVHEMPVSETVYRVVLRRSDEKILFRLSQEDSAGKTLIERAVLLDNIEEIDSVAPRLVYALVNRGAFRSSRVPIKAGGFTTLVPIRKMVVPGVGIGLSIDRLSYAIDVEGRFAREDTGYENNIKDYFHFYSFSFGGRYFFMKRNISPYIGGGIGVMFTNYTTTVRTPDQGILALLFTGGWDYDSHTEEADDIGVYGVLGVELLRFSRGQLKFELRMDRPFFKLPSQDVMPITLGIAGGFSF